MEGNDDKTKILVETITKELVSIIDDEGLENESEKNIIDSNTTKIIEKSTSNTSRSTVLDYSIISNIDDDIKNMQSNLDETCKLFQSIGERFENINFGCLKNRIKDLRLHERSAADSIKTIVNDLKYSFEEKYMENRLDDLTKEVTTKFQNHPGEFGDIPEISEFFRTCTKLEQGLEKLRKQRDDCMYLQKRMTRVAEVSYERINDIQQNVIKDKPKENI